MNILKTIKENFLTKTPKKKLDTNTIYNININAINGAPVDLSTYQGKYMLIVNVASRCGFTHQYKELQELQNNYGDLIQVVGVPCNQFGGQEPDDEATSKNFCEVNFGVNFLLTEKVKVKGPEQHPLYTWLTQEVNNGVKDSTVKWNFQKYLLDPNGKLVDYYLSSTNPLSSKIINHLK